MIMQKKVANGLAQFIVALVVPEMLASITFGTFYFFLGELP